ncbi:nitrate/nitrite transporter NrtS [Dactylococcopsis salina]
MGVRGQSFPNCVPYAVNIHGQLVSKKRHS